MKRNDGERTFLKTNAARIDSIHCDSVIILVQKKNGWTTSHSGAMFMAQDVSFSKYIVKLIDIYG